MITQTKARLRSTASSTPLPTSPPQPGCYEDIAHGRTAVIFPDSIPLPPLPNPGKRKGIRHETSGLNMKIYIYGYPEILYTLIITNYYAINLLSSASLEEPYGFPVIYPGLRILPIERRVFQPRQRRGRMTRTVKRETPQAHRLPPLFLSHLQA